MLKTLAQKCLDETYNGTISFPEILEILAQNNFESYHVDYLKNTITYYHTGGETIELSTTRHNDSISKEFNADGIRLAVQEAQENTEGYTYKNFCRKVTEAGCVSYFVSLLGRRVLYWGRTAEIHVEYFPQ